ncbi:SBBP repeat-containing protein [Phaeodactylibacter xiamenensis]|uniref:DUF7948 domain-containing protein n=1 Tax=Phaeodactylibacter xiamenensis TaxID=1524460 RepID=UPI003CCBFEFE
MKSLHLKFQPISMVLMISIFLSGIPLRAQQSTFYLETWQASQGEQPAVSLDRVLSTPSRLGGVYTVGSSYNESGGYYDLLVTHYNLVGAIAYQDTFNLPTPGNIIAGAITTNSSLTELFITGTVYSGSANSYDVLTLKYDINGQVDWYSTYNGIGNGYDGGSSLLVDSDTIYVGGAITDTTGLFGALCIKYIDGGTEVWDHVTTVNNRDLAIGTLSIGNPGELTTGVGLEFNNGTHRVGSAVLSTSDGSMLSGFSENSQVDLDEITGFAADADQNLYVTGYSDAAGNGDDIVTVMLDDTLGLVWESVYNGSANSDDRPSSLDIDTLGNVYVGGYTIGSNGKDFAVIKYNNSGTQQWAALYDGASHGDDEAKALVAGKDGLVYATGSVDTLGQKDYHTRILKASDGTTEWSASFNGLHSKDDEATSISLDGEGGLSVLGKNGLSGGKTEYMLVRYAKKELTIPPGDGAASPVMAFIEQRGQLTDTSGTSVDDIRFYSLGTNPSIFARKDTLSLVGSRIDSSASTTDTLHRVDISFKDSKSSLMSVAGLEKQPYYKNYYLDHIQEGRAKVGQYGRVVISDLYDNINLQLFASPSGIKYYFVVEPGGDPTDIELELNGQDALAIDSKGRLEIQTSLHDFLLASPSSFQLDTANQKTSTSWQPEFNISGSNVTFDSIGVFDTTKVLVIVLEEPISKEEDGSGNVEWCTYFGGTSYEEIFESDVTEGNEYAITGLTFSPDFPVENGVFNYLGQSDAFVSTFDSELNLSWSSYIGGNFDDRGNDVVFSGASGFNLILVGSTAGSGTGTNSAGFPILDNGFSFIDDSNSCATENSTCRNAFITLFTADGQINHSTFFGVDQSATITGGTAQAFALHESPSKNIYIGGLGVVPTNTITGGDFTDYEGTGFIAKFGNNLSSIEWSTGFMDKVSSINSDGFGNIFVLGRYVDNTGDTYGAPIQENSNSDVYSFNGGSSDIGISKINEANNDLVWFSYFGGNGGDNESAMDVDNQGNVVFTGETSSTDFQVQSSGVTGSLLVSKMV